MKKIAYYIFFLVLLSNCFFTKLNAQNNNSPYSIIGIGDLEQSYLDRTSGMGHAGVALSGARAQYMANPASLSMLDEHFFNFEIAVRYRGVNYYGQPIDIVNNNQSSDIQFKRIAMAIKVRPKWAIGFGLSPFSTANYSFYANKVVQGTPQTFSAYYTGTGSTNLFYITNSYKFSDHFSVGLQASYLFGQLGQTETISGTGLDSNLVTNKNTYLNNPYLKFGMQYRTKIAKKWKLAIGASGSLQTKLNSVTSLLVTDGTTTLINNPQYSVGYFTLPDMYTAGIALTYKEDYTFAADYTFQNWQSLNYRGLSYNLVNSSRLNLGFEYSKKNTYRDLKAEKTFYQAGFFAGKSYVNVSGQQIDNIGGTVGIGFNALRSSLTGQVSLEGGVRGTTINGLVQEDYLQVTFILGFREFWLPRHFRRYD
jgi:hypothetical protein